MAPRFMKIFGISIVILVITTTLIVVLPARRIDASVHGTTDNGGNIRGGDDGTNVNEMINVESVSTITTPSTNATISSNNTGTRHVDAGTLPHPHSIPSAPISTTDTTRTLNSIDTLHGTTKSPPPRSLSSPRFSMISMPIITTTTDSASAKGGIPSFTIPRISSAAPFTKYEVPKVDKVTSNELHRIYPISGYVDSLGPSYNHLPTPGDVKVSPKVKTTPDPDSQLNNKNVELDSKGDENSPESQVHNTQIAEGPEITSAPKVSDTTGSLEAPPELQEPSKLVSPRDNGEGILEKDLSEAVLPKDNKSDPSQNLPLDSGNQKDPKNPETGENEEVPPTHKEPEDGRKEDPVVNVGSGMTVEPSVSGQPESKEKPPTESKDSPSTESKEKPPTETKDNPSTETKDSPSPTESKDNPSTETKDSPSPTESKDNPTTTSTKGNPAPTESQGSPASSETSVTPTTETEDITKEASDQSQLENDQKQKLKAVKDKVDDTGSHESGPKSSPTESQDGQSVSVSEQRPN